MDIGDFYTVERHDSGAKMQVKDEFGKKKTMYIIVAGIDSKLFRKVKHGLSREIAQNPDSDIDEIRAKSIAKVTLGWEGFLNDGEVLEFTPDLVEQLYTNAPYLMDQVDSFINKRANFTKG